MLAVNITGQFDCVRLAVPYLHRQRNPSIVNLSSAAGRLGFPMRTLLFGTEMGLVVGFTKSLAMELGPDGIRVNTIPPGIVEGDPHSACVRSESQGARDFVWASA